MEEFSDISEICEFAYNLNILHEKSQKITEKTVSSISSLEVDISRSHSRLANIFGRFEEQERCLKNIEKLVSQLDAFQTLFDSINEDRLKIAQGPQGAFEEFIQKLLYIKRIEQYHWIKELSELERAHSFRVLLRNYDHLFAQGEKMLVQEFQDVVKHYSNSETMSFFIEHLTNEFEKPNECESDQSPNMFIPKATVQKLEEICWWFLQQEQQYELYNENHEHCDINQKLKYSEIRNDYLNKLTLKSKDLDSNITDASTDLTMLDRVVDHLKINKHHNSASSAQCIEMFERTLDFSLKLLKHENILVASIYCRSPETRVDLISRVTILVINGIMIEFEHFFTHELDFTKIANNGENVVVGITNLLMKVANLKEKATCLQTEDLSSASKLLQFSIRLNEMSSHVFFTYLEVVKTGYFNESIAPIDCSVHEHCVKTLELCRVLQKNVRGIGEALKKACDMIKKAAASATKVISEESDEVPQEYLTTRSRRSKGSLKSSVEDDYLSTASIEDDFLSTTLAIYTTLVIDNLLEFLVETAIKYGNQDDTVILPEKLTDTLRFDKLAEFKYRLKALKAFTFLVNNMDYIKKFLAKHLNMMSEQFARIQPDYESNINQNFCKYIDQACGIFRFLAHKWDNITTLENDTANKTSIKKSLDLNTAVHKNSIPIFASSVDQDELSLASNDSQSSRLTSRFKAFNPFVHSKQKKKSDFLLILNETLNVCARIKVANKWSNKKLTSLGKDLLGPVLLELDLTEELLHLDILDDKNCKYSADAEVLIEQIFKKIFPIELEN